MPISSATKFPFIPCRLFVMVFSSPVAFLGTTCSGTTCITGLAMPLISLRKLQLKHGELVQNSIRPFGFGKLNVFRQNAQPICFFPVVSVQQVKKNNPVMSLWNLTYTNAIKLPLLFIKGVLEFRTNALQKTFCAWYGCPPGAWWYAASCICCICHAWW